jgi:hypothetical protein
MYHMITVGAHKSERISRKSNKTRRGRVTLLPSYTTKYYLNILLFVLYQGIGFLIMNWVYTKEILLLVCIKLVQKTLISKSISISPKIFYILFFPSSSFALKPYPNLDPAGLLLILK